MEGRILAEGHATGPALVLDEPLSLWGGLDPATGEIVETSHPQRGCVVTGTDPRDAFGTRLLLERDRARRGHPGRDSAQPGSSSASPTTSS